MNAPFRPIGAASAHDDRAVCPDCGSAAQGSGMFGRPYCGLCYRSIPEFVPLTPVTRTAQGWGSMSAGPRREGETKRDHMLRVWYAMTPKDRDYDRFVARSIPEGATWSAETEGGRLAQAERDRLMDEATNSDGCSCHINPPCSYCMRETEEEAA